MFEFGKNWKNYLKSLDESRIEIASLSLQHFFEITTFKGKRFLDAGSGSGLFSLAARKLGAKVVSFDLDKESVQCVKTIKDKYYPSDENWEIKKGSLLDTAFIKDLGIFDIAYCWGVAHHTGNMKKALTNLVPTVKKNGLLYLAIYNDQGWDSINWKNMKKYYSDTSSLLKPIILWWFIIKMELKKHWYDIKRLQFRRIYAYYKQYHPQRGMNRINDCIDWIIGYPFEVAKPEVIFDFFRKSGFELQKIKTCGGGLGNNEYLFKKK